MSIKLLWLDLETTGLDPRTETALEICCMVAPIEEPFAAVPLCEGVIHHDGQGLSDFIRDMHTRNGLLAECAVAPHTLADADHALAKSLPPDALRTNLVLAGSSVHFDLGFVRAHLPEFAARISHRIYDVSSIKLFCQSLGMPPFRKAEAHRARPDILESIQHARECAAWLGR